MHQRIAVHAFERAAGEQRAFAGGAEQRGALDHQKRPQPLAAAEHGVAHGGEQPRRPRDLARQRRIGQQPAEQGFGCGRRSAEPRVEIAWGTRVHRGIVSLKRRGRRNWPLRMRYGRRDAIGPAKSGAKNVAWRRGCCAPSRSSLLRC